MIGIRRHTECLQGPTVLRTRGSTRGFGWRRGQRHGREFQPRCFNSDFRLVVPGVSVSLSPATLLESQQLSGVNHNVISALCLSRNLLLSTSTQRSSSPPFTRYEVDCPSSRYLRQQTPHQTARGSLLPRQCAAPDLRRGRV